MKFFRQAAGFVMSDSPMALGDHLDELRARLIRVLLLLVALLIVGIILQNDLKRVAVEPLRQAVILAGPEVANAIGLDEQRGARLLTPGSLAESPITGFTIALFAAFTATFPYLVYQLWGFVAPALRARERAAGFWMLPAAVLFFYGGVIFGFMIGLPYFYSWLLSWAAGDPTVHTQLLRQQAYFGFFVLMTVCFGLVMDIPWVVIVLARTRLVPPGWFAKHRKILLMIAVVISAVVSPPDPYSQLMLGGLMVVLFEAGLLVARMMWKAEDPNLLARSGTDSEQGGDNV